jgi:hypothetical protein
MFTVALDIPAPPAGTDVALAVNPSGAGTLPATVTVAADTLAQTFTYSDVAGSGAATVTATLGASTSEATVTVSTAANHLVINEVDYDQVSSDLAEYIEIFNPTPAAINLTGYSLMLVNGNDSTTYATIDLGPAGTLPAMGYLVIGNDSVTVPASALKLNPSWGTMSDKVQNGAPDGIALVDTTTSTVIDALSYEGSMTAAQVNGISGTVNLVEGTALDVSVADSNIVTGALCRSPDGTDTDDANTDWKFCSTLSPGAANP